MATSTAPSAWQRWLALLKQRCPRCLRGPVFAGIATMHERCPNCGLHYEREPGYFMGAMYISYSMSIVGILLLMLCVHLLQPDLDLGWAVLIASALYVPAVPLTWRYSRVLWMYFDQWAWPDAKV